MSGCLKKQLCFLNNLLFYLDTTEESKMSYWDSVKDGGGLTYTDSINSASYGVK